MRINPDGLSIIREFETLELDAYYCPANVLTIGYGHTGPDVYEGQSITEDRANQLLAEDVAWAEDAVNTLAPPHITDNQFSALVSFVFNVGVGAFERSTLLRKLRGGDISGAACEFGRWNKSGGRVLRGLTRRRLAERVLFETSTVERPHGDYYGR